MAVAVPAGDDRLVWRDEAGGEHTWWRQMTPLDRGLTTRLSLR